MDEPTGWRAASDVARLHDAVRQMKAQGVGIMCISLMLDEIFAICDSLMILGDGQMVAEIRVDRITRPEVVAALVGERLAWESLAATGADRKSAKSGQVRLAVRGLGRKGVFRDVAFVLLAGEILCVTGLIFLKRTEMVHGLFGSAPNDAGEIHLEGKPLRPRTPAGAMASGIGLIPADRYRDGLMQGCQSARTW